MKVSVFSMILIIFIYLKESHTANAVVDDETSFAYVTYGSAIKLRLVEGNASPYLLHSDGFSWGSGSGQQVVSLIRKADSSERTTLWQVEEGFERTHRPNGQPIRCGDTVRFFHLKTKKYLHSHKIPSMLSPDASEVSAFNDSGDSGDNWIIACNNGTLWKKGDDISIRHEMTGATLRSSLGKRFDQSNCPRCPINGHLEVVAKIDKASKFRTEVQGLFFGSE